MTVQDELRALVDRYAAAVDHRDFGALADVFVPDGELITPLGRRQGLAEIRAAMSGLHRYHETEHRVGAAEFAVDGDGDTATGRVACEAHHITVADGRRNDRVMVITYDDRYELTASGWRIRSRRLLIDDEYTVGA